MNASQQTLCSHAYVVTYRRPWYKLFRPVYSLRCWHCDLNVRNWG